MGLNDCVAVAIGKASVNISNLNILANFELFFIQIGFLIISGVAAFYVLYLSIKIWISLFAGFVNAMCLLAIAGQLAGGSSIFQMLLSMRLR